MTDWELAHAWTDAELHLVDTGRTGGGDMTASRTRLSTGSPTDDDDFIVLPNVLADQVGNEGVTLVGDLPTPQRRVAQVADLSDVESRLEEFAQAVRG